MSLQDQIAKDLIACIKKRDLSRVKVLRFLQSGIKNKVIALRPEPLSEDHIFSVLRKQIKQIKESLEHYKKAGLTDRVQEEEFQLLVLESYLPKALSEEELTHLVRKAVKNLKAASIKDMGSVMKTVLSQTKGQVEGHKLSQLVRKELSHSESL